jgi:hypothetical protein
MRAISTASISHDQAVDNRAVTISPMIPACPGCGAEQQHARVL